jgi:type II secretory ATPase GspE/PulE/Tfp pilus assembly ATPase PilB-like protein
VVLEFILNAAGLDATDLQFTPTGSRILVTACVEGVVGPLGSVPTHLCEPVTNYIKRSAKLDVVEKMRPQKGSVLINTGGRTRRVIVATRPLDAGEQIVLRFPAR